MRRILSRTVYLPLAAFLVVFALIPAVGMLVASFQGTGGFTLSNYAGSLTGQYFHAFTTTTRLALFSAVIGTAVGAVISWSSTRVQANWLSRAITAIASVMANFAGLSLAVAFMVTLGTTGIVTVMVSQLTQIPTVDLGWNLASFGGLLLIYTSFQIPLAVVLLLPAFLSLQREWEEAVYSLGANLGTYVLRIVAPILFPSLIGTLALLFANAFSAYVTAFAIAGGTINLLPIQIGYLIDGNLSMNLGLGDALAMEEMAVLGIAVAIFLVMQRFQFSGRQARRRTSDGA